MTNNCVTEYYDGYGVPYHADSVITLERTFQEQTGRFGGDQGRAILQAGL
jgi:hypothetical protein